MPTNRLVMVTGGAGFIGSNLVDGLLDAGYDVRVIDNFLTGRRENLNPRAELVKADIREFDSIRSAFKDVDCVFHTAAWPRVPLSLERPMETHMVNVIGTLNVLMAARDARVRRLIYSGSSSVYGNQTAMPLREDMKPSPLNPYGLQKLTGEEYVRLFHQLFSLETLTLRYFNVFGPRMASEGAYVSVMSAFIRAKCEGKALTIHGDGEQSRDFTHVADVVRANIAALNCEIADGRPVNIGRGSEVSINQLAAMFGGPIVKVPSRPGDPRRTRADHTQASKVLGWRPMVSVEEGVRSLLRDSGLK